MKMFSWTFLIFLSFAPFCQIKRVTEETFVVETTVWLIHFLINMLAALKGSQFIVKLIFAQKIDCGCTLELPPRGSNEYPQSMFWIKNKENIFTPVNPSFTT